MVGKECSQSFIQTKLLIHQNTLAFIVIQILISPELFFNLAKVNIVPCICRAAFSLRQGVDGWIESKTDA